MIIKSKTTGRQQWVSDTTWEEMKFTGIATRFTVISEDTIPTPQPDNIEVKKNKAAIEQEQKPVEAVGEGDKPKSVTKKKQNEK